jgi:hypothetical protein
MRLTIASPLTAQSDSTQRTPWEFYHGCWSTSSAGAAGPMVCVVPDSTPQRVEMLSVIDDVIISRMKVDVDGRHGADVRGSPAREARACRWQAAVGLAARCVLRRQ